MSDWQIGIELFNEGKFWESHEAFEREWTKLPEAQKLQIQAIIQVAAMFHLFEKNRIRPALALARSSLEKFQSAREKALAPPYVSIPGIESALQAILADTDLWPQYRTTLRATWEKPL